ncbi:MAG: UDP-N-acetylmuramoyl-tripeptide--D-alanyl-D-alanine ligase, partial [Leptospiraceae bacterium]|nr:UDP-N-acetylmuramoyl-tripeptide--D-alanyl-D-alanine ligase [Leptospiraceae bacterium]
MRENFNYSIFAIKRILSNSFQGMDFLEEAEFQYISISSIECDTSTLFVPLRGNRDGHEFIPDAIKRGVRFFLCERNHIILESLSEKEREGAIFVDNTLIALGKLAEFHRKRFQAVIIAVTGSSGKTTTKELLHTAFKHIKKEELVVTEKNYNNEIGLPFTLFRIGEKTKLVICELGMNHRGEIARLSIMAKPSFAMITNVGTAHIEYLGSTKEIARAKAEIMEGMERNTHLFVPEDIAHLNIISKQAKKKGIQLHLYGIGKDKVLDILEEDEKGFLLKFSSGSFRWNFIGKKILYNLSGVYLLATKLKQDPERILTNFFTYENTAKRLNIIDKKYKILDDCYNANPDSIKSSLEALKQVSGKAKTYAILGDMKELGEYSKKMHKELGKYAYHLGIDAIFSFGKDAEYISKSFQLKKGDTLST